MISACMIVRNEARCLPAALRSLQRPDVVGEIVVCDTGSTDGTREIARGGGGAVPVRLIEVPWQDDFSHARNAALAAARGSHCLMLDADEEVDAATWPSLLGFLAAGRFALGRVLVCSATEEDGEPAVVQEAITRLCPNDPAYRYQGRIHEQLSGPGGRGDTGLRLLHSGYLPGALARKDTVGRNLALLRAELAQRPDDAYLHFQLGRTLVREHPAEAAAAYEEALRRAPANAGYLGAAVLGLGQALRAAGRPQEALSALLRQRRVHPGLRDFTDLHFLEGLLHLDIGNADAMLAAFHTCLMLGEGRHPCTVEGVGSYRAHYNLGLFYELSGEFTAAARHYGRVLSWRPGFRDAAERCARVLRWAAAEEYDGQDAAAAP